jgi:hypothetical protein
VIAVFLCSLSLSTINTFLAIDSDATREPFFATASFATHALVVVLDMFAVLTMTMIYYFGQLHIGHGMTDAAAYFVQRNPSIRRLRRLALDMFWLSAPLFMLAMAFTFLSQVRRTPSWPRTWANCSLL